MNYRFIKLALIAIALLAVIACSNNKIKPNKLSPLTAKVDIRSQWQRFAGFGSGKQYRLITPVIVGDTLYVNDHTGQIFAYEAESGRLVWKQTLGLDMATGLGANETQLFATSLNGDVIALDLASGETLWQLNIDSEILAPPQANQEYVFVQTQDGRVVSMDATTGKMQWSYGTTLPELSLRGTATPLLIGNDLVTGFANGKLMALSGKDGTLFWERRIARPQGSSEIERVVDIDGQPILSEGTIFTSSYNGTLRALSTRGETLWSQDNSSYSSPIVLNGRVYVSSSDGIVQAYDARQGFLLWQNSSLLRRKLSAPQEINGFIAVADYQGFIHIFDAETGVLLSRRQVENAGVRSPMVSKGDQLFVLGDKGALSALQIHLANPEKLKQLPTKKASDFTAQ